MKSARYLFVAVMGAWMGAAGIEHGVGEFLQGNISPNGVIIQSWPHSAFFQSLNGEPALTILPNLRLTGLMAIVFSMFFAVWSIFFAQRKNGGWILMLLAIPMLLFDGGIFPPILGLLIGLGASTFRTPVHQKPIGRIARFIGLSWRWILPACCISWLALLPGVAILNYFFGIDSIPVTLVIISTAFCFLFLTYWSSILHDRLMLKGLKKEIEKPIPNPVKLNP
ncbi:MAG: hypothetical protein ACYDH2_11050 [Anaerolineaceae bacterium]